MDISEEGLIRSNASEHSIEGNDCTNSLATVHSRYSFQSVALPVYAVVPEPSTYCGGVLFARKCLISADEVTLMMLFRPASPTLRPAVVDLLKIDYCL